MAKEENIQRVSRKSLDYPGDGLYYLDDKPFTGVAYTLSKDGSWVAGETEYRDGLESGPKREWAAPGKLLYEAFCRGGLVHGKKRRWLENGDLTEDGEYEYGIPLWEKVWDEDGNLIDDYKLKETDANYERLMRYRRLEREQSARRGAEGTVQ